MFVTDSYFPTSRYERVCSSWTAANQELYWVVMLV